MPFCLSIHNSTQAKYI